MLFLPNKNEQKPASSGVQKEKDCPKRPKVQKEKEKKK